VARRLLRVGERTGAMAELLERCATFHDDETTRRIETAVRLFEPLLMLLIGAVIGVVVLLMYAPIFELAGSLG
jgi:general secretion pathway protein F